MHQRPDVALRLVSCGHGVFEFRQGAIGEKRRPKRGIPQEAISQLVAAQLYYEDRRHHAEQRLKAKRPLQFLGAQRQAETIVSAPYSVTDAPPPRGGNHR